MNPFLSKRNRPAHSDNRKFQKILSSWQSLHFYINALDENTLIQLFIWERERQNRIYILNRLKARHGRLRDARERNEIFGDDLENDFREGD